MNYFNSYINLPGYYPTGECKIARSGLVHSSHGFDQLAHGTCRPEAWLEEKGLLYRLSFLGIYIHVHNLFVIFWMGYSTSGSLFCVCYNVHVLYIINFLLNHSIY